MKKQIKNGTSRSTRIGWFDFRAPTGTVYLMQPDNDPATNMWFWYDIPAMATQAGEGAGEALPVVIEAGDAPNPGGFPIGGQTNVNIANNHLQYAFTWYSLAITLIVIYFVFHWRRGSKEEAP